MTCAIGVVTAVASTLHRLPQIESNVRIFLPEEMCGPMRLIHRRFKDNEISSKAEINPPHVNVSERIR